METIVRHGTGARLIVKSATPTVVTVKNGVMRVVCGVPPVTSTPSVPVVLAKSA